MLSFSPEWAAEPGHTFAMVLPVVHALETEDPPADLGPQVPTTILSILADHKEYETEKQLLTYPDLPAAYCWGTTHLEEVTLEEVRCEGWMGFLQIITCTTGSLPKCEEPVLYLSRQSVSFKPEIVIPPLLLQSSREGRSGSFRLILNPTSQVESACQLCDLRQLS